MSTSGTREGSLEAPTRHPLDWREESFYDQQAINEELERVFDICHGCRRCVSLCKAFPTLFDLVDESSTMEVDGVDKADYSKVVDECYLCDLCYLTKCPYVPPHEWNVDFPHLMLRAKAANFKANGAPLKNKMMSSTDLVGSLAGIPVVAGVVNTVNKNALARKGLDKVMGVHPDAKIPEYHSNKGRKRLARVQDPTLEEAAESTDRTTGKVAIYATCYGQYNDPQVVEDLTVVLQHNGIAVRAVSKEKCCGMPKLELGDLESVAKAMEANLPPLLEMVDAGWDIIAPVPSCVLMFKQELPLMFPEREDVARVRDAIFDPFEYLMLRHRKGLLKTEFPNRLGKVAYHAACHQRVQKIGPKTSELLQLIPDTEIINIERCSGHDGTYGVKSQFYEHSRKICRPVVNQVDSGEVDHYGSDCPMAGRHIENGLEKEKDNDMLAEHPLTLLRLAYGC
ncbi:MAG: heterodisulfide reductase-related iron-sulfur binding cluster [Immundisolibacteraceae bacterium]|nr:heterodisulfide reductase-related iron-sulfur binding cluster [Immundisolibacteraceae bacterium]